jgi:hypothetical protein
VYSLDLLKASFSTMSRYVIPDSTLIVALIPDETEVTRAPIVAVFPSGQAPVPVPEGSPLNVIVCVSP